MDKSLFLFPSARQHHPAVEDWLLEHMSELGALAARWFRELEGCGADVCSLLHDGHPTACVGTAAFAYVAIHKAHVNLGFFQGAALPDPQGLLQGSGKRMRHVRLAAGRMPDSTALKNLIRAAYQDMQARLDHSGDTHVQSC